MFRISVITITSILFFASVGYTAPKNLKAVDNNYYNWQDSAPLQFDSYGRVKEGTFSDTVRIPWQFAHMKSYKMYTLLAKAIKWKQPTYCHSCDFYISEISLAEGFTLDLFFDDHTFNTSPASVSSKINVVGGKMRFLGSGDPSIVVKYAANAVWDDPSTGFPNYKKWQKVEGAEFAKSQGYCRVQLYSNCTAPGCDGWGLNEAVIHGYDSYSPMTCSADPAQLDGP